MKTVVTMVIYLMSVQDQVSIHPGPCKLYDFIIVLVSFFGSFFCGGGVFLQQNRDKIKDARFIQMTTNTFLLLALIPAY